MMMKLDASDEMIECHGEQWIFVTILNGYKETMIDKYGPVMDIELMHIQR
jgi:hypothetical protein